MYLRLAFWTLAMAYTSVLLSGGKLTPATLCLALRASSKTQSDRPFVGA